MFNVNDLQSYKKKVHHYLIQHKNQMAIYKLNNNKPLTQQDVEMLEEILWKELGTKEDYQKDFGETPRRSHINNQQLASKNRYQGRVTHCWSCGSTLHLKHIVNVHLVNG